MKQSRACPRCESTLEAQGNWWRGRLPNRCPSCGIKLLFDTVGGIYAHEERNGIRGEWIKGDWHRQDDQR